MSCRKCADVFCRTWFREFMFTLMPAIIMGIIFVAMHEWQQQKETRTRRIIVSHSIPPLTETVRGFFKEKHLEAELTMNFIRTGFITDARDTYKVSSVLVPMMTMEAREIFGESRSFELLEGVNNSLKFENLGGGNLGPRIQGTSIEYREGRLGEIRERTLNDPFAKCNFRYEDQHTPSSVGLSLDGLVVENRPSPTLWIDPKNADDSPQLRFNVDFSSQCIEICDRDDNTSTTSCSRCVHTGSMALRINRTEMAEMIRVGCLNDFCTQDVAGDPYMIAILNVADETVIAFNRQERGKNRMADYTSLMNSGNASAFAAQVRDLRNFVHTLGNTTWNVASTALPEMDGNVFVVTMRLSTNPTGIGHREVLAHIQDQVADLMQHVNAINIAVKSMMLPSLNAWQAAEEMFFTMLLGSPRISGILHAGLTSAIVEGVNDADLLLFEVDPSSGALRSTVFYLGETNFKYVANNYPLLGESTPVFKDAATYYLLQEGNTAPGTIRVGESIRNEADRVVQPGQFTGVLESSLFTQNLFTILFKSEVAASDPLCSPARSSYGVTTTTLVELRSILKSMALDHDTLDVAVVTSSGLLVENAQGHVKSTTTGKVWDLATMAFGSLNQNVFDVLVNALDRTCEGTTDYVICNTVKTDEVGSVRMEIDNSDYVMELAPVVRRSPTEMGFYLLLALPKGYLSSTSTTDTVIMTGAVIFAFIFIIWNVVMVIHTTQQVYNLKHTLKCVARGSAETTNPVLQGDFSSNNEVRALQKAMVKLRDSMQEFRSLAPAAVFQDGSRPREEDPGSPAVAYTTSQTASEAMYTRASAKVDNPGAEGEARHNEALSLPNNRMLRRRNLHLLRMSVMDAHSQVDNLGPASFSAMHGRLAEPFFHFVRQAGGVVCKVDDSVLDAFWDEESGAIAGEAAAKLSETLNNVVPDCVRQGIFSPLTITITVTSGEAISGFVGSTTEQSYTLGGPLAVASHRMTANCELLQRCGRSRPVEGSLRSVSLSVSPSLVLLSPSIAREMDKEWGSIPVTTLRGTPCVLLHKMADTRPEVVEKYRAVYQQLARTAAARPVNTAEVVKHTDEFTRYCEANAIVGTGHPLLEYLRDVAEH